MSRLTLFAIVTLAAACVLAQDQPAKKKAAPKKKGPPAGIKLLSSIDYAGTKDPRQALDIYVPQNGEKRPLIVWIHGGGWQHGSKEGLPILWALDHGYALASINYRYSTAAKFPAQIHDCKGAIRFLRAHAAEYGYDATRIAIGGSSAGGHLVALLGTSGGSKEMEGDVGGNLEQSSVVQAVLDLFGPADFQALLTQPVPSRDRDSPTDNVSVLLGDTIRHAPDKARAASAATYVTKDDPPFLILQGDLDDKVPPQQSIDFHALLQKTGVESELVIVKGAGHGGTAFNSADLQEKELHFFDKHLKPAVN